MLNRIHYIVDTRTLASDIIVQERNNYSTYTITLKAGEHIPAEWVRLLDIPEKALIPRRFIKHRKLLHKPT